MIKKPKLSKLLENSSINDEKIFENKMFNDQTLDKDLSDITFNSCYFKNIDFSNSKLENIDIIDSIFEDCNLTGLNLSANTFMRNEFIITNTTKKI